MDSGNSQVAEATVAQTFGLLAEGRDGAFVPDAVYVRQDDKVFFFHGGPDRLCEALETGTTVVSALTEMQMERVVLESEDGDQIVEQVKDGQWIVEGPFQRSDTKNANKRMYPRKIWERQLSEASPAMSSLKAGGMVGHLEHPKDGRMDGNEGAIKIISLTLREDGVVWGRAKVLGTPKGKILREYIREGVRWGVSSRGNGSVNEAGTVNEDYQLMTFDAVMSPSTPGAYPVLSSTNAPGKTVSEGTQTGDDAGNDKGPEQSTDVQGLEEKVRALCATDLTTLDESERTALASKLLSTMGRVNALIGAGDKSRDLQGWLTKKLQDVQTVSTPDLDAMVTEALEGLEDEEDGADTSERFQQVVTRLQSQVSDAVAEADSALGKVDLAEYERDTWQEEAERLQGHVDFLEAEIERLKEDLALAAQTISDLSETDVDAEIAEAVDAEIRTNPKLLRYRDALLEEAECADDVHGLVVGLTAEISQTQKPSVPAALINRPSVPTAGMVVESGRVSHSTGRKTRNPSRGARLAAQASANMKKPAPTT